MIDAIIQLLRQDPEIQQLTEGRIIDANDFIEISRSGTPQAFDENNEVLPTIFVKTIIGTQLLIYQSGYSAVFQIYFYDNLNYRTIIKMRNRCRSLLQDKRITPIDPEQTIIRVIWDDDTNQVEDVALSCPLEISNYRAMYFDATISEAE